MSGPFEGVKVVDMTTMLSGPWATSILGDQGADVILPGWTVPCISPYVTKVVNYMKMVGIEHEIVGQDLTKLDQETP